MKYLQITLTTNEEKMNGKKEIVDEIYKILKDHDLDIYDQYEALSIGALACLNLMYEELEIHDDRFKEQFMKNEWEWSLEDFLEYDINITSVRRDRGRENE